MIIGVIFSNTIGVTARVAINHSQMSNFVEFHASFQMLSFGLKECAEKLLTYKMSCIQNIFPNLFRYFRKKKKKTRIDIKVLQY